MKNREEWLKKVAGWHRKYGAEQPTLKQTARLTNRSDTRAAKALAEFDGAVDWDAMDEKMRTAYRHGAEMILDAANDEGP